MPTGWRPKDMVEKFPLEQVNDPYSQIKYKTNNSSIMLGWSWVQHIIAGLMMFHLFMIMNINNPSILDYSYAAFIIIHIFSLTSILDYSKYSIMAEFVKMILGVLLIYYQNNIWFSLNSEFIIIPISYLLLSFGITIIFYSYHGKSFAHSN